MFEPSNEIERLLVAATKNEAERPAFSKAVLEAELYVAPTSAPDENGRVEGVRSWKLKDGTVGAAIFTAPERAEAAFGPGILHLSNKGRAFLEWLRPGPVVLNPGQDYGVVWDAQALATLLDGMATRVVDKPTKVLLAHPKQRPDELIARLNKALGSDPAVTEAYLLMMQGGGSGPEGVWLVGVRSRSPWPTVQALIKQAVDGYQFEKPLDVVNLDDSSLASTLKTGIPILAPRKARSFFNFFRKD
jgi:hypothetical protein